MRNQIRFSLTLLVAVLLLSCKDSRNYKILGQHRVSIGSEAEKEWDTARKFRIIRSQNSFVEFCKTLPLAKTTHLQELTNFNFATGILIVTLSAEVEAVRPLIGNTVVVEVKNARRGDLFVTEVTGNTNAFFKFTGGQK